MIDRGRVDELKEDFQSGKLGLCAGGLAISWQSNTDADDLALPEDGRSSNLALLELCEDYDNDTALAHAWDYKLVELFSTGIRGKVLKYPLDDSLKARQVSQCSLVHV
jgi:hypothetical protein